ncbi:zinc-dependent alcohol dehydrogenase family protein [Novosphingobium mangrovi (ex Hu et al. 2023)]|uniref:NAD(P)-dependent alcohol dehydrogenase n=1 Tax=Novosphingobium mangrovi (ex Hu et al. 2023) TaxID=2930094 RepID=A0ABT0A9P0_9SPHN|nr:NAD(P)-dependent alcohol dehydrogenase [Novosphingobium mangrovi (ex Hu et al. 2023)]MCJ1959919.1 NAD(P)-dependent alcohol dehydrogenase [Novosphingobium mangrovi (ex Hu et al. 2023)]
MKAYVLGTQEGISSLTLTERPDPVAGPGEAVLKVRLACLNNRDIQILEGRYGAKKAEDRIPLAEGLGEVVSVGDGVTQVAVGDRAVCPHFVAWHDGPFDMSYFGKDLGTFTDGWAAEYIKVPAGALVKVPEGLSDEAAAPLAAATLTAWHAVSVIGEVKAGDLVLALGTGGVSMAALQIAKANGAFVAITSSSDEKLEEARKMGADYTVNYRTHADWAAELLKQTGGRGADIIAETGGQHTLPQSINAAACNARVVLIGVGSADGPLPNYGAIIGKNLVIKGIASGSRGMLVNLLRAMDANGFAPVVDKTFAFEDMAEALEYLKSGGHQGKVMVKVS